MRLADLGPLTFAERVRTSRNTGQVIAAQLKLLDGIGGSMTINLGVARAGITRS